MTFSAHLEENLFSIQRMMKDGTYTMGPYRKIWVYIPKKRLVMALPYPDRIVQWSLYLCLSPFYEKIFIEDSYACRQGKGSHKAVQRLQYWMQQISRKPDNNWYVLKLDISKYFYRVDHEKLLEILGSRIKDPDMMKFLRRVINSETEPFGLPPGLSPESTPKEQWRFDVGMPIGNLTSQLFANIYLNELDQFCKHELGVHFYIRYMDDVIILSDSKADLNNLKHRIELFLKNRLKLDLNRKTSIRPIESGVEFVGIRIWPTHKKLRKSTVRRKKKEVRAISAKYAAGILSQKDFERRVASIKGSLCHTESESLRWRLNQIYQSEMEKAHKTREAVKNGSP